MPSTLLDTSTDTRPRTPLPQGGNDTSSSHSPHTIVPCNGMQPSQSASHMNTRQKQPAPFGRLRDLPILGRAQGGSDGNMTLNDTAIDWTFRPADLQGVRDAFAVFVTGDSMVPKYKNQDLAYVHPSKRPVKDRFVLVETVDHSGFIKQFIRWDGDTLVLRQFNPAQEILLPRQEVLRLMLVIGSLDA